ncbi:DUF5691 domain-containing protein [Desulfovibrio piger]|nr:DUF5691 domain-containing protein [Desulfovibrio piger]
MAVSELTRVCLVGSDKGGSAALARDDSPMGAALREADTFPPREGAGPQEEDARKLLLASGLVAPRETTRLMTPQPGNGTPPALEEEIRSMKASPAPFLDRYPYQVVAWLRLRGACLPDVALPAALRIAVEDGGAWEDVLGRIGERLCRDNPAWRPLTMFCNGAAADAISEEELRAWEDTTPDMRLLLLQRLRARDPRAGRELAAPLLREQFRKNEKLLCAFLIGLSAEDIPFLEECLQKRKPRKFERYTDINPARVLLSLLPESRLYRRLARDRFFVRRDGKLEKTEAGEARCVWPMGVPLQLYPLSWWLEQTGMDCGEFLSVLMARNSPAARMADDPVGMRIFLENNAEWTRLALDAAWRAGKEGSWNSWNLLVMQVGMLAARMLPREEIERWLHTLFGYEGKDPCLYDGLSSKMMLYAPFALPREIWKEFIEMNRKRAELCRKQRIWAQQHARAGSRYAEFLEKSSRLENIGMLFSMFWNAEIFEPDLRKWMAPPFRGTCGRELVIFHFAWIMPLDLLEEYIRALTLPSEPSWSEVVTRELDTILRFRERAEQAC